MSIDPEPHARPQSIGEIPATEGAQHANATGPINPF